MALQQLALHNFALDSDSSVVTPHGEQQGVAVGYNVKKPGGSSHHPFMAFVVDVEMVANLWLALLPDKINNDYLFTIRCSNYFHSLK